jgi:hypothetical protein
MRRSRPRDESTTVSSTTDGGLVQKIFFPSFIDAGFNESFNGSPVKSLPKTGVLDRSVNESVGSEASTAVRDNRSNPSMPAAHRKKKHPQQQSPQKPNPPSFFASTKPSVPAQPQTHPHHLFLPVPPSPASDPPVTATAPTSPPKVTRRTGPRASAAATSNTVSSRFPFDDHPDQDDTQESFKDASSIAIVSNWNPWDKAAKQAFLYDRASYGVAVLAQHDSDSSSSLSLHKPAPRSIFDDATENDTTGYSGETWEEEATPAQTAFGKRLLFQRVLRSNDTADGVSSTASENGSLFDACDVIQNEPTKVGHSDHVNASAESGSTQYATPPQQEYSAPMWDENSLALPVLDEKDLTDEIAQPLEKNEAILFDELLSQRDHIEEKKVPDRTRAENQGVSNESGLGTAPVSHSPGKTTAGLLSMAIRRLGSGLTNSNNGHKYSNMRQSSISAPSTPRAAAFGQNYFCTDQRVSTPRSTTRNNESDSVFPQQNSGLLPSSFLLRSPGSVAFQTASETHSVARKRVPIAPRFTHLPGATSGNAQYTRRSVFSKIPENEVAAKDDSDDAKRARPNSAFQIARSCFSFDAYDTSLNERHDFTIPNHFGSQNGQENDQLLLAQNAWLVANQPRHSTMEPPTGRQDVWMKNKVPTTRPILQESASWDFGFSPEFQHRQRRTPFRPRPLHMYGLASKVLQPITSISSSPAGRTRMPSEFSPCRTTSISETQELKSPQRIEIERDDALDILACLVERGVSWKHDESSKSDEASKVDTPTMDESDCSMKDGEDRDSSIHVSEISAAVKELQELSLAEEKLGDFHSNSEAHHKRKLALEELLRSHEYALEMKRASQSASHWLKSIGRSQSSSPSKSLSPTRNVMLSEETTVSDSPLQGGTSETDTTDTSRQAAGEESSASENIDLLTAKAMLRSMQMEARDKTELANRLNEELVSLLV